MVFDYIIDPEIPINICIHTHTHTHTHIYITNVFKCSAFDNYVIGLFELNLVICDYHFQFMHLIGENYYIQKKAVAYGLNNQYIIFY